MLTTEELLRPRYKVIADFPGCSYEVDMVLYVDPSGELYSPVAGYSRTVTKVMECDVDKYPHLFQPLPWWSDREIGDLPEFVKSIKQEYSYGVEVGRIIKVKEWVLLSKTPYVIQSKNREYHPACFEPATPEHYNQQKEGMK